MQTVDTPVIFIRNLLRVIFRRGSPERILYTRKRFIVGLFLALFASALAQAWFYQDHLVFVILRVFAELTCFMMAMVILTAKIPRFRLAYLMLVLVFISLGMDVLLLGCAALLYVLQITIQFASAMSESGLRLGLGIALALPALYGASSCVAWGLRKNLVQGVVVMLVYAAAVTAIDLAFRGLYEIMAAG